MELKKSLIFTLSIIIISMLSACGTPTVKKFMGETSIIEMTVLASDDLNPNKRGRPSPAVIYLYELSDVAPFDENDFFGIYDNEASTIGAVLLGKQELEIKPGEKRVIRRSLKADTRYIGILAAFRDVDNAKWRASIAVAEHSNIDLTLYLDRINISIVEH